MSLQECPHGYVLGKGCDQCAESERMKRSETALNLENISLRAALRAYGQHTSECDSHSAVGGHWHKCDCGWDECEFNPDNIPF